MSDDNQRFPKSVIAFFILSLSLVLVVLFLIGDIYDSRSFSGIEPKSKIIDVNCHQDGLCEQICVGYNDVSMLYPMEECE